MQARLFPIDTALLTNRCVVRRFREHDGPAFHRLVTENQDYLRDHFPALVESIGTGPEEAEAFLRRRIAAWLLQEDFAFGVWSNETTQLIGYVHLFDLNWEVPLAQLSFFIDREHTQQGLMTEVLARLVRFSFRQLELEKLYLLTLADNYPSQRLIRKIGFGREGTLRNEFRRLGGGMADLMRFGLTREQYGE